MFMCNRLFLQFSANPKCNENVLWKTLNVYSNAESRSYYVNFQQIEIRTIKVNARLIAQKVILLSVNFLFLMDQ